MTLYSQRDARWRDIKLGTSNVTIGGYGCTITCLSMLANLTPDVVNAKMTMSGGYANGNLVNWTKIKGIIPTLELEWRGYTYDNNAVKSAISRYGGCLVEVDFDGTERTDDRHWVVFKGNQKMWDPWTGTERPTSTYPILRGFSVIKVTQPVVNKRQELFNQIDAQIHGSTSDDSKAFQIKFLAGQL